MRKLNLIMLPLLLLFVVQAMADNVTVANIETKAGESAEIVVSFTTSATNLTGYQMSLYLPDGIALQKDQDGDYVYELSSRHNRNHVFSVNEQADGGLLLVCYSPTKKTIATGSGELLRLPIDVASSAEGTLAAQFKTIKFSDTSSNVTLLNDASFTVTIAGGVTPPPTPPSGFSLYPAEFSVRKGEASTMNIMLDNEDQVIMTEFYMELPAGLYVVTDEDDYLDAVLNVERVDRTHTIESNLGNDGLYHFLVYSSKNKAFTGNSGELISVKIACDENVEAGEYQGVLKNILLSDANKQAIELADRSFSIEVTDYILGDVNDDRRINGMDIVEMVELVMGQGYAKAADLYPAGRPDGVINGMDLVEEVELVMSQTVTVQNVFARACKPLRDGLVLTMQQDGMLAVGANTGSQYIMAQMSVELSDGMRIDDVVTDNTHNVAWKQVSETQYVIVAWSDKNNAFEDNGALVSLHCLGKGSVTVNDVLLCDINKQECHLAGVSTSETTGIGEIKVKTEDASYDLQGRRMAGPKSQMKKGVYVMNGRKVVVK